jgi:hypothetical protein
MEKPTASDEWVVGATLGAYVFSTFVLHFWGSAFIHQWCGNSPYPDTTKDGRFPASLVFLIPGAIVGLMDWAQIKAAENRTRLVNQRAVRTALWMNLFGISAFLIAVAGNYGPESIGFFAIISMLGLALWPLGLALSVRNLTWACIQWVRIRQPKTISSR